MAVVYDDRTQSSRVVTPKGSRTFSLTGGNVSLGVSVDGGYAVFDTFDDAHGSGGLLLDTTTGATTTKDVEPLGLFDGRRELVAAAPRSRTS